MQRRYKTTCVHLLSSYLPTNLKDKPRKLQALKLSTWQPEPHQLCCLDRQPLFQQDCNKNNVSSHWFFIEREIVFLFINHHYSIEGSVGWHDRWFMAHYIYPQQLSIFTQLSGSWKCLNNIIKFNLELAAMRFHKKPKRHFSPVRRSDRRPELTTH